MHIKAFSKLRHKLSGGRSESSDPIETETLLENPPTTQPASPTSLRNSKTGCTSLSHICKKICHFREVPRQETPNIFDTLSGDLIIYLTNFLPVSSLALFAMTCRKAYNTLGSRYWEKMQEKDQLRNRMEFLEHLSRDLPPNYVPCHHCRILHYCKLRYRLVSCFWIKTEFSKTICEAERCSNTVGKHNFRVYQMALKMHRLGYNSDRWLQLLDYSRISTKLIRGYSIGMEAHHKIVGQSMLSSTQWTILIRHSMPIIKPTVGWEFPMCPHRMRIFYTTRALNLQHLAPCALVHDHALERCVRRSKTESCLKCPTEFDVRIEDCGYRGNAFIITRWQDLGEGRTVLDPRWWSHLNAHHTVNEAFQDAEGLNGPTLDDRSPVQSSFASIRDAYRDMEASAPDPMLRKSFTEKLYNASPILSLAATLEVHSGQV
ncbi:hypothetical protein VTL71DRAFT_2119 [Oculimacula yallundae]|uniref:F-box domain-containing protein n=1 Tax=Oculimacula yallundae TaxID=86028 RepID=A0ABR4C7Z4_9HELO